MPPNHAPRTRPSRFRRAFFESVGLEIIEIKRPENIYEALFESLS